MSTGSGESTVPSKLELSGISNSSYSSSFFRGNIFGIRANLGVGAGAGALDCFETDAAMAGRFAGGSSGFPEVFCVSVGRARFFFGTRGGCFRAVFTVS
jgi:hypothetical protein